MTEDKHSRYNAKRVSVLGPLTYTDADEAQLWQDRIAVLTEKYGSKKSGVEAAIAAEVRRIERRK